MSKINPRIMSGMMELLPEDQIVFNDLLDTIKKTYEKFGFSPIDTPVLEYSDILLAKAGGETEKQIYRFKKGDNDISLRFDLTVPLSRYVSMRYNDLVFPFKRYQIGKVYRGERPQNGRYREFYQCDIDVLGENLSILYDAEIPSVIYEIFKKLDFGKFIIKINNRKILNGLFKSLDLSDLSTDILRIIDKLDKIGIEKVEEELVKLSIDKTLVSKIVSFISISGPCSEVLDKLKNLGINNDEFNKGIEELSFVISNLEALNVDKDYYEIDLTIARGLDYYTGTIYETILENYKELGSVCSGGRYDKLVSNYSDINIEGVGISIGITRLYSKLKEANLLKTGAKTTVKALIIPFDNEQVTFANKVASIFRENSINTSVFYDNTSFKKKLNYANKLNISYVALLGEDEVKNNTVTIKNMENGSQETIPVSNISEFIENNF